MFLERKSEHCQYGIYPQIDWFNEIHIKIPASNLWILKYWFYIFSVVSTEKQSSQCNLVEKSSYKTDTIWLQDLVEDTVVETVWYRWKDKEINGTKNSPETVI